MMMKSSTVAPPKASCSTPSAVCRLTPALQAAVARRGRPVFAESKGFGSAAPAAPKKSPAPSKKLSQQLVSASTAPVQRKQPPAVEPAEVDLAPGACPCCSGKAFEACCGPHLAAGGTPAPTPEATLRARFSAFVKGSTDYLISTTHADYLGFHYGHDVQLTLARQQLATDTQAACDSVDFKGLMIAPPDAAPAKPAPRAAAPSPRGGSRRRQEADSDAVIKLKYRHSPREAAAAAAAPGAPAREWTTAVEEVHFRRGTAGMWQMSGYNQRFNFSDASALVAQREAEAAEEAAGGPAAASTKPVSVRPRDWKLDVASRTQGKGAAKAADITPVSIDM